jgi:chromosome segregation protein
LIWNGSESEPRANRASVKVKFDNTKKVFNIDFPEVTVERVVHRDGVNQYLVNGSTVRLKDVLELLASAHIGASGHHIISQGEADKILSASPKDRKAMIEDALGLKLYQYKRAESERKLEKTFENITQVEGLRREIAPHLKFLRKQVEKIEKVESMQQELIVFAREYFKREDMHITHSRVFLKSEREPLQKQSAQLSKELAEAKKILEKAGDKEKKNYVVLALESEMSAARGLKDTFVRELGKIEGSIAAEERTVKRQRELAVSDEHKMVRLSEVERFVESLEKEEGLSVRVLLDKLLSFIRGQKDTADAHALKEAEASLRELQHEHTRIEKELKKAEDEEQTLRGRYDTLKKEIETEKDTSHDAEKAVFRIMSEENEIISKLNLLKSQEERLKAEEEEFRRELEEVGHLVGVEALKFKDVEVKEEGDRKHQEARKHEIEKYKIRLEDSGVGGMEEVVKEYKETSERDEFLSRELLDLEKSAESLRTLVKELEERLATEFSTGLKKINEQFGKLFSTMFGGGDASLTLTREKKIDEEGIEGEEETVVEEGLEIRVNLPRKKIRSLMMLSGGERALTSIALIFAISQVNPPPFIILDETDAALDESNSKKYGDLVETLSKYSQLILITHNRETMGRAGTIYGVTMGGSGASKLLSIDLEEAVQVAK